MEPVNPVEPEAREQDSGTESCVHQGAVMWNPYNRVVQCHRCGQVFVPTNEVEALEKQVVQLTERVDALENNRELLRRIAKLGYLQSGL